MSSEITIEKLNNIKIKPLIQHSQNQDEILGGKMFLDPYSNCCIIAKKKSGKTTALFHILKKVCRGGSYPSNVLICCSTVNKDPTYKQIIDMLKKKGCNVSTFTHFFENGENIVNDLLKELQKDEDTGEKKDIKNLSIKFENDVTEDEKRVPRKPSKLAAEYVLVFDDLGSDMRKFNGCISHLSKVLRHYKMRCFYLQQFITDLDSPCRKQMDYALLFKSFNFEKLKSIHESLDLSLDLDRFIEIYKYVTREPYHFLYIDVRNEEFRDCFDKRIIY